MMLLTATWTCPSGSKGSSARAAGIRVHARPRRLTESRPPRGPRRPFGRRCSRPRTSTPSLRTAPHIRWCVLGAPVAAARRVWLLLCHEAPQVCTNHAQCERDSLATVDPALVERLSALFVPFIDDVSALPTAPCVSGQHRIAAAGRWGRRLGGAARLREGRGAGAPAARGSRSHGDSCWGDGVA